MSGEEGAQQAVVKFGVEDRESKAVAAEPVAILARDAGDEPADENLIMLISDDGIGGADSRKGSGLIGIKDRIEVLGGLMRVASPRRRDLVRHCHPVPDEWTMTDG